MLTEAARLRAPSWSAVAAAFCFVIGTPLAAEAHLGHVILNAERYIKLDISDEEVRVVVSLTLGASEGQRVLEAADTNGDRRVTQDEADAYLAQWGDGLEDELPIHVGDDRMRAQWQEAFLDPLGRVRAVPVTVELVAHVPLGGGEEVIRVQDRMVRREVYDRTDVAFRARGQALLLTSGAEAEPTEVVRDLSYDAGFHAGEAVLLVARVETPERAGRTRSLLIAGGALALLLLVGVWQRFARG
ncbi:MAG: hypothetical protein AB8I08_05145 [Sandaracinaceae bacterium]